MSILNSLANGAPWADEHWTKHILNRELTSSAKTKQIDKLTTSDSSRPRVWDPESKTFGRHNATQTRARFRFVSERRGGRLPGSVENMLIDLSIHPSMSREKQLHWRKRGGWRLKAMSEIVDYHTQHEDSWRRHKWAMMRARALQRWDQKLMLAA